MSSITDKTILEMTQALPPVFAGKSMDDLTGDAITWSTIQNARSRREIPVDCFIFSGRKVLVRRDPFLAWWKETLHESVGVAA